RVGVGDAGARGSCCALRQPRHGSQGIRAPLRAYASRRDRSRTRLRGGPRRERTKAAGTARAHGFEAAARALRSEGKAAEARYREAVERLNGTLMRIDTARARLLYGEWLPREG